MAAGKITARQALENFMSQWDTRVHDSVITREEFYDYYRNVGGSIDSDKYFDTELSTAVL